MGLLIQADAQHLQTDASHLLLAASRLKTHLQREKAEHLCVLVSSAPIIYNAHAGTSDNIGDDGKDLKGSFRYYDARRVYNGAEHVYLSPLLSHDSADSYQLTCANSGRGGDRHAFFGLPLYRQPAYGVCSRSLRAYLSRYLVSGDPSG